MWVPAHLADVESDMSAVHRVDDIHSMPAARFFQLAWRLPHYRGVVRDLVLRWQQEAEEGQSAPAARPAQQQRPGPAQSRQVEPVTEAALADEDPAIRNIFSFG